MNVEVFYVSPGDVQGSHLVVRGEEFRHLARVLRKNVGDHLHATDGDDTMFEAVVTVLRRDEAECEIVRTELRKNEPRVSVTLGVSLLKNPSRFETLVEKTTELGVRSIVPLVCERTVGRQVKHDRYEKIAVAAMKQCARSYRPRIFPVSSFEALAARAEDYALRLIPHEQTEQSQFIGSVLQHHEEPRSVLLLVGPEGGFTDREIATAGSFGFIPISLGPRRLRTETAAIAAVNWVVAGR